MAWTTSGLYVINWMNSLGASNISNTTKVPINLLNTNNKVTMYSTGGTPDFTVSTTNGLGQYTTTNEVTSTTGTYTAGGIALTAGYSQALTDAGSAVLKYTHTAVTWSTMSITAWGALWYNSAITSGDTGGVPNPSILAVYFGGAYTASSGTFTITPSGSGIFTIDFTP